MSKQKKKRKTIVLDIDQGNVTYQASMLKFEELVRSMSDKIVLNDQVNAVINKGAEALDRFLGEMFPKISVAAAASLFGYVSAMGLAKTIITGINTENDAKALTEVFHVAMTSSLPAMVEYMKEMQKAGKLKSDVLIIPGE